MIIDAASQHRHRIETPDAVGCIASTATMRCDDDVGSPGRLFEYTSSMTFKARHSSPLNCPLS